MKELPLGPAPLRALVESRGGQKFLDQVLEKFYNRMSQDTMIGFFFTGRDLRAIAHKQRDFLMKAWGLSAEYTHRPPARAHEELPPILPGHFDRRLQILKEVLIDAGLNTSEIKAWIAFESSFRGVVINSSREEYSD